jgi:hypothetical protein
MFRGKRLISSRTIMGAVVLGAACYLIGGSMGASVRACTIAWGVLCAMGGAGMLSQPRIRVEGALVLLFGVALAAPSLAMTLARSSGEKLGGLLLSPDAFALLTVVVPIVVLGWACLLMRPRVKDRGE